MRCRRETRSAFFAGLIWLGLSYFPCRTAFARFGLLPRLGAWFSTFTGCMDPCECLTRVLRGHGSLPICSFWQSSHLFPCQDKLNRNPLVWICIFFSSGSGSRWTMSFSWVESVWLIWHMCHFHHKLDMNIHSKSGTSGRCATFDWTVCPYKLDSKRQTAFWQGRDSSADMPLSQ